MSSYSYYPGYGKTMSMPSKRMIPVKRTYKYPPPAVRQQSVYYPPRPARGTVKSTYVRKASAVAPRARTAKAASSSGGWLAPALSAVGSALLPGIGGPIGAGLGSLIKSVTGFGEYKVQENTLIPEAGSPPSIDNTANGKVAIIKHREYISDIVSSATPGAFSLQNFYINPADSNTFPWLSGIACNYEHYQIRGMIFEFKTMSSDALNSTNTALGQVIMATEYNSALDNFSNKYEMENYEFGASVKPSCSLMHPIECKRSESVLGDLYCRPGSLPDGQDRRLYDFGNFQIATNGLQAASVNVGELWVTYEVALYKPKLWSALGNNAQVYQASNSSAVTTNLVFGTISALEENATNTLDLTLAGTSTGTITFPSSVKYGKYLFKYSVAGDVNAAVAITVNGTRCTSSAALLAPAAGTSANIMTFTSVITVTDAAPVVTISSVTMPTTNVSMSVLMIQLPFSFTSD